MFFCVTMVTIIQRDFVEVKKCIRCRHDDVDRRYCMELELVLGSA